MSGMRILLIEEHYQRNCKYEVCCHFMALGNPPVTMQAINLKQESLLNHSTIGNKPRFAATFGIMKTSQRPAMETLKDI